MHLNINHESILGFALPHLPYSESVLKQVFSDFELFKSADDNDIYKLHFRKPGDGKSLFGVAEDTDYQGDETKATGYCCWLKVFSSEILLFDKYRVNQTCLKDVSDLSFDRVDFDPRETCLECEFDFGTGIKGTFFFYPPEKYSGSIKSMNQEQIENCVLTSVVFNIGSRNERPKAFISEQEGAELFEKMLLEYRNKPLTTKAQQTTKPYVSPVNEILKKSFDFRNGVSAYLRLANIAVHTGVKSKVKQALSEALDECGTNYPSPQELFEAVLFAAPSDNPTAWPVFSVDWKGTINDDLDFAIRGQLAKLLGGIDFPNVNTLPRNAGLLDEAQLIEYAKQIEDCGYDLYWGGLAQTDSHEFMLVPVKNRNKMKFFIRDSRCEMALVAK